MRRSNHYVKHFNTDFTTNKNLTTDKTKTTNVNILLNRLRLDKKRDLKKKLIFLSLLVSIISAITIFALI